MTAAPAVRLGDARDRPFVLDLGERTVLDSVASFRAPIKGLVDIAYERLVEFSLGLKHALFVAEAGGQRVGFLILLLAFPDEATLEPQAFVAYMAVEPAARRQGFGRALLAAAEDHARVQGMPYLALMVTQENEAALRLYESLGFLTERRLLCKVL